jgi:hypothetical protein
MNQTHSQSPTQPHPKGGRQAIIAFSLAVAALLIPLALQYIATSSYNTSEGQGGTTGWGISVLIYAVLTVGLLGWPMSIAALIVGILAVKKKVLKGLSIAAVVIAATNLALLPILALMISAIVGQP